MNKVFIIAEAGVNHNGNIDVAKKLVDVAIEAGADAIKFQSFKADTLVSQFAEKAEYQKKTTHACETQFQMIKKLELDNSVYVELNQYCSQRNIMFLSSPFDIESIRFLSKLGLNIFKIPSGEITNFPYLREIGKLKKKVILSTGMADLGEIEDALNILTYYGTEKKFITALHCNTEYPTPLKDVNLRAMLTIQCAFQIDVGYSDHTLGIEVPIAAVALGAKVIEKHFTLDKNMEGPDQRASLEPIDLKNMIKKIRNIESALGHGIKQPSVSELKNINITRKSIVASRSIKKGEYFSEENICSKRAGSGISPLRWSEIIGRTAIKDFNKDEVIEV